MKKDQLQPKALFDTRIYMQNNPNYYINLDHIKDKNDYKHAINFLLTSSAEETFISYRKELEKFLQWTSLIAKKTIKEITKEDIIKYLNFCKEPIESWIGSFKPEKFISVKDKRIPNLDWRPFVIIIPKKNRTGLQKTTSLKYKITHRTLTSIITPIESFYNYLISQRYVKINPMTNFRLSNKTKNLVPKNNSTPTVKKLTNKQWNLIVETAEIMTQEDIKYERTLFLIKIMYSIYPKVSELIGRYGAPSEMNDFFQNPQDGSWWFQIFGQNKQKRIVPVSDNLLQALKRYRKSLGLTPLPLDKEDLPLLLQQKKGTEPITDDQTIRNIVQFCLDRTIARVKEQGLHEDAKALQSATLIWIRNTGISHDIQFRPREHVRDDAGHSSTATTEKYIEDVDARELYLSMRDKKIKSSVL